ncbi:hypothetical protein KCU62_g75, partial [Aureobasidium sp. EXF-3399]
MVARFEYLWILRGACHASKARGKSKSVSESTEAREYGGCEIGSKTISVLCEKERDQLVTASDCIPLTRQIISYIMPSVHSLIVAPHQAKRHGAKRSVGVYMCLGSFFKPLYTAEPLQSTVSYAHKFGGAGKIHHRTRRSQRTAFRIPMVTSTIPVLGRCKAFANLALTGPGAAKECSTEPPAAASPFLCSVLCTLYFC